MRILCLHGSLASYSFQNIRPGKVMALSKFRPYESSPAILWPQKTVCSVRIIIYNFVSPSENVIELMTVLNTQNLHSMIWLGNKFISFNFKIKTNNNNTNNQNNNKPQQQQQTPQMHAREMDQVSEEMVRSEKKLESC